MKRSNTISLALAVFCTVLLAAPSQAQQGKDLSKDGHVTSTDVATAQATAKETQRQIIERRLNGEAGPDYFGLQCCQVLQIPASAFHTIDGAVPVGESATGYLYASAYGGFYDFWAPVELPSGALIVFLDLYYYDTSASDLQIDLRAYNGGNVTGSGGSGPPGGATVASVSSTGAAGYDYSAALVGYTVNNNVAYDPAAAQLTLRTFFTATDGTEKFKAVDIWWARQISPAPGTQTFNDVAPGDFGYQQIEALVASGITGGCGGGNFCPNANLTRAQMAIFLAKALGLYWQY
jgi:hypothetical protein